MMDSHQEPPFSFPMKLSGNKSNSRIEIKLKGEVAWRFPGTRVRVFFLRCYSWMIFISSASTWLKVYIASVETFIFLLIIFFSQYTRTQTTSPWCWDPGVVLPECRRLLFPLLHAGTSLCIMRSSTPAWFGMISKCTSIFAKETWFSHSKTWKFTKKWICVAKSINFGVFEWLYLVPILAPMVCPFPLCRPCSVDNCIINRIMGIETHTLVPSPHDMKGSNLPM